VVWHASKIADFHHSPEHRHHPVHSQASLVRGWVVLVVVRLLAQFIWVEYEVARV
jgi:hypothetical protein